MAGLRLDKLRSQLIEPIQLELQPGELVFLSGPSGAGKSLLLRAIADLDPNEGEAWLDDQARSTICAPDWRRQVGLLPAESGWWSTQVGEHFPQRPRTLSQASGTESGEADTDWLPWLQILGFGPEVLDWEVARLSTGERQRLALARLLATNPAVLLLDEATANLDPDNAARVESLVQDYRRSRQAAVLWVSHDPAQRQRLGDRAFRFQEGKLIPEPAPGDQ